METFPRVLRHQVTFLRYPRFQSFHIAQLIRKLVHVAMPFGHFEPHWWAWLFVIILKRPASFMRDHFCLIVCSCRGVSVEVEEWVILDWVTEYYTSMNIIHIVYYYLTYFLYFMSRMIINLLVPTWNQLLLPSLSCWLFFFSITLKMHTWNLV